MFGKPAIASNVTSLSELIFDVYNGFLVPLGDSLASASKIYLLALDEVLRRDMSDAARKMAQKFRMNAITRGFVEAEGGNA